MIEKREPALGAAAPSPNEPDALQKLGWSFRARYEDHDPNKPIIGVRLTNCAKIFDTAQSIQIMDQRTVTIQFGFLQEQSVSLTDEDGALFIDWLKATHPDLAAPMLATVPAGDPTPGSSNTGLNMSKAHLAEYLADAYPQRFGRGARATKPGADFYTEVLAVLHNPHRDHEAKCALILAAENMAHDMYADCNATLRRAARAEAPEVIAEFQMDAYGRAMAAETARAYARAIRARLPEIDRPPAAEFPEAIELESLAIVAKIRALNGASASEPAPAGMFRSTRGIPYASDSLATTPDKLKIGVMVSVIDPNHPRFRQMGMIDTIHNDATVTVYVKMSGRSFEAEPFKPEQLASIA